MVRPLQSLALLVLVALTATLCAAAIAAWAPADDVYYCGYHFAGPTDCAAFPGGYYDGYFDTNHGYVPGGDTGVSVCEHVYDITQNNNTVSRRCLPSYVSSNYDLGCAAWSHDELSAHVGNGTQYAVQTITGHAYYANYQYNCGSV
jgi:hypothetical protein